ncbi:hypothetical protein JIQ42_06764 [Leishmania sp. Namibia]|uniref:hypothetical protein n=1 Tax=Leishmania sp. Namibia TaxID=2802991 RepID=UPI001B6A2536|nr:hypothetical protein JIQ42_06764 [Leishmania sp. Namibia]
MLNLLVRGTLRTYTFFRCQTRGKKKAGFVPDPITKPRRWQSTRPPVMMVLWSLRPSRRHCLKLPTSWRRPRRVQTGVSRIVVRQFQCNRCLRSRNGGGWVGESSRRKRHRHRPLTVPLCPWVRQRCPASLHMLRLCRQRTAAVHIMRSRAISDG